MPIYNIFIVFALSGIISIETKQRIENSIPVAVLTIILFFFVFSICGIMGELLFLFLLIGIAAFFIYVYLRKKKHIKQYAVSLIFTPGFFAFLFFSVFMWWFSKNLIPTQWDEFSHWALTIKNMYYTDELSTSANAITFYKTYPPAMALWQYFFVKLSDTYHEGVVYYAYNMFLISMMMPVYQKITWKNVFCLPLATGTVFCIPYLFYSPWEGVSWSCLFADAALALCFCYALTSYFLEENKQHWVVYFRTGMALAVLGLLKSTGNFTSAIVILIVLLDRVYHGNENRELAQRKNIVLQCGLVLGIWLLFIALWKIHLVFMGTPDTWKMNNFNLKNIVSLLMGTSDVWHYEFVETFVNQLSNSSSQVQGKFSISFLMQPVVWFALLACTLSVTNTWKEIKRFALLWIILLAGYLTYICSLYLSYLFLFSKAEAMVFAGMPRYLSIYWVCVLAFSVLFLVDKMVCCTEKIRHTALALAILFFIIAVVPLKQVVYDLENYDDRVLGYGETTGASLKEREQHKKIKEIVSDSEKIYIISNSQWFLISNYELYPIRTNIYGEHSFGEFDFLLDADEWTKKLAYEEYNYIWIEQANDMFISVAEELFADKIEENTLYKIVRTLDGIRFFEVYNGNF